VSEWAHALARGVQVQMLVQVLVHVQVQMLVQVQVRKCAVVCVV
jgi:hypothetical protein